MTVELIPATQSSLEEILAQRDRLFDRLRVQRARASGLWDWYWGRQDPPAVVPKYRSAYKLLLNIARTPWARLVVDTVAERLHVEGFRGVGSAESDAAEDAAWSTFVSSRMTADEWLVYVEALITGVGYVSVAVGDEGPVLSPESAMEVTHEPVLGDRRQVAAAIKVYPADWSGRSWFAELYRPEATYRWFAELVGEGRNHGLDRSPVDRRQRADVVWFPDAEIVNSAGVVPVIPFENRATVLGGGESEIEDCVPVLRRIDKLTLDKLMTSEFAGFRQRWATGLEVPVDPSTGQQVEPFSAAVNRLWISEDTDTKFGSFDASDLGPYLSAIDAEIAALAAITRVPSHYLMQQSLANPPSAESLLASESGLVAKVEERQRRFGESWEQVTYLAGLLAGTAPVRLEVVWKDAEMRNPAQVADAAVKLAQVGVPDQALWEYIGASPEDVERWRRMGVADELTALLAAPTTTPPAPVPGG